jgi:hypothetical protein
MTRWTCANGKEGSRGTKEVLVIGLHMVGKMSLDLLNLETLKFLMHFRELGSSFFLFLYHTYSYFFSFLLFFSYSYFCSLFIFLIFSFSFSSIFFICSP